MATCILAMVTGATVHVRTLLAVGACYEEWIGNVFHGLLQMYSMASFMF